tara:strand:- start:376 stop:1107 length:732 start_codon:yes stop_codon:yes gene_type:complete
MFLFSAAKKVAEVAGVIDEPKIEVIADLDLHWNEPQPVNLDQHITAKQIGNVPPFVRVIDPADDLAILEELFGVYRDAEKVMEMSCPECHAEYTVPYQTGLGLDAPCECPDCEYEDTISDFLDSIEVKTSTSRTPSDLEVLFATKQEVGRHWDMDDVQRVAGKNRDSLMGYYAVLKGNEHTLGTYDTARGRRDDGIDHLGRWMVSCGGCQSDGDGCQCANTTMKYFGRMVSIKGMDDVDEDDE